MKDRDQEHSLHEEEQTAATHSGVHYEEMLLKEAYEHMKREKYEKAVEVFEEVLRKCARAIDKEQKNIIHRECAMLYFWLSDYDAALRHADSALSIFPDDGDAYVILGKIAVARFEFAKARDYFAKLDEENPERAMGLCLVCLKLRDVNGAAKHLSDAAAHVSITSPEYIVYRAYLTLLKGSTSVAVQEARDIAPKCVHDPILTLLVAEIYMTAGHYGEAVSMAKKVGKGCPVNDHMLAILAHAAYAQDDLGNALYYAKAAVEHNPKNAYAKTVLMKHAVREGAYSLAESIGLEILKDSPEYSLGHANLGDVYFNQGRYELAEIEYEQTQALMDSTTKGALLRTARMKFIHEDYKAAIEILEDLVDAHHTYYDDAMCDLLLCYEKIGDTMRRDSLVEKMQLRRSFFKRTEKLLAELS